MGSNQENTMVLGEYCSHLYANVDDESLRQDAETFLLDYGMPFQKDIFVRASGNYVFTSSKAQILDWTSGQMSSLLGHGHPEVANTILKHALELDHLYGDMLSPPVVQLGKRLVQLLPDGLDKAFFLSTGSESNEAAIKLAKIYTGKFEVVGLGGSWHGMTGTSVGAQYHGGRSGYGPMMPGNLMLPAPHPTKSVFRNPDNSHNWKAELDYGFSLVDAASCGSLAAVIVEPIISSGGILVLPYGYLQALKIHCEARGMLLILDEAQTGIARTGKMFGFQHEEIVPDILTLSKGLGNGFPLSAVVTSNKVAQAGQEKGFFFCTTHVNDPLAAAVGLKVLDVVIRDKLVDRAAYLGARLRSGLELLKRRYGCIGDVRGRGLMVGIEIFPDLPTGQSAIAIGSTIAERMRTLGLWTHFSMTAAVFRLSPPITTTESQLDFALEVMEEALKSTPHTRPFTRLHLNL